ncbi:MAG: polysaccharide deacetylase family protein, partial [Candidatus Portnoybacteria bacterium]|nr:polysaccharide deacetylase family protein [Candidatus Portnoybacteria bacterium]
MKTCFLSIDVEFLSSRSDKENKNTKGIKELNNILNIFKKHNANATLFTTGEVLEEYKDLAKQWAEKYEIACHNYRHVSIDNLTQEQREKELDQFKNLYKEIFNKQPTGYRAPRNIIDNEQMNLLQEKGFLYDSSVFPRYPWPKKYAGYKGRAPKKPYHPSKKDYKKQGGMKILEIPES